MENVVAMVVVPFLTHQSGSSEPPSLKHWYHVITIQRLFIIPLLSP